MKRCPDLKQESRNNRAAWAPSHVAVVAQVFNLLYRRFSTRDATACRRHGLFSAPRGQDGFAEWNSAIRQIENLRYDSRLVLSRPTLRP
jgi:hypothetical protein